MAPLTVGRRDIGDVALLSLRGDFDAPATPGFVAQLGTIEEQGIHRIVLNMRLVKFATTTAFGAMLSARNACRRRGGNLVVSQPSKAVWQPLQKLGLDALLSRYDDDESALDAVGVTNA